MCKTHTRMIQGLRIVYNQITHVVVLFCWHYLFHGSCMVMLRPDDFKTKKLRRVFPFFGTLLLHYGILWGNVPRLGVCLCGWVNNWFDWGKFPCWVRESLIQPDSPLMMASSLNSVVITECAQDRRIKDLWRWADSGHVALEDAKLREGRRSCASWEELSNNFSDVYAVLEKPHI